MQWRRIHGQTVLVPAIAALLCGELAAHGEVGVVARAWNDCDIGINAGANSLGLALIWLPTLWFVQTVGVAVPAPFLALLSRNRLVVAGLMVLLALVVVVGTAWAAWSLAGLPISLKGFGRCTSPDPAWWPSWLPPTPGYPD